MSNGEEIFQDGEEYYRQVARNLQYAGKEIQFNQREYLLRGAQIEEIKHNFVRALEYYQCFLTCSKNKDNHLEQAQALVGIAIILKLQGNWEKAIEYLQSAIDVIALEKSKDSKRQVNRLKSKILAEQGFLFIKIKNFEKANDYLSRARLNYEGPLRSIRLYFLPREKSYLEDLVEIYLNLAEIWYRKFDETPPSFWDLKAPIFTLNWNTSDAYFKRAEIIAKKYGVFFSDNMPLINLLVREGEIFTIERRDLALEKLFHAISSMEKQKTTSGSNDYATERAYSHLAEIYRDRNEPGKARQHYEAARKIQEKLQDIYGLAISNGGIGDLYIEQGIFDRAEFYLLEAFKYQQQVGDSDRFWRTCFSLVKVYLEARNLENAVLYWNHARPIILEHSQEIKSSKIDDIYTRIYSLANIFYEKKSWEDALPLCMDLQVIAREDTKLVKVSEMLGKIYYELKDPDHAIQVLYQGLDLTTDAVQRADIHSFIGDICSSSKKQTYQLQAEENYEECVKIFLENKLSQEALGVYDKLLRYMSSEKDSQRLAPYLHSLIDLMFRKRKSIDIRFLEKAENLFKRYELYKDAGDAFVHLANKMVVLDRPEEPQEYQDKPAYQHERTLLKKAEEYYKKAGNLNDEVGGYYSLLSVYFRMDLWDEIARCYRLIFNICMDSIEPQVFIDALREVVLMNDKFNFSELKEMITGVENVQSVFASEDGKLDDQQKFILVLLMAKLMYFLSGKAEAVAEKEHFTDFSLKKYGAILDGCYISSIKEVAYNDSALILEDLGRLDEAKERLVQSIDLARSSESRFSEACGRANLAGFMVRIGNDAEARTEYEESIGVLIGANNYWDERKENQDSNPLVGEEIALLRFQKHWCASIAENYGYLLCPLDPDKAVALLRLSKDILTELGMEADVLRVAKNVNLVEKISPQLPQIAGRSSWNLQGGGPGDVFLMDGLFTQPTYIRCSSCGYSFDAGEKQCPRCSARTCPYCGQIMSAGSEFCEHCDHYVG